LIFSMFLTANAFAQESVIEATAAGSEKDYNRGWLGRR